MNSPITTHILDTATGSPAAGVPVALSRLVEGEFAEIGRGVTDADGRHKGLMAPPLVPGTYRMRFDTGDYWKACGIDGFYPYVEVVFSVTSASHHHVPLLLSPYSFSTYRGS